MMGILTKDEIPTDWEVGRALPPIALTLRSEFQGELSEADEARLSLLSRSIHGAPHSRMITFPRRWAMIDQAIIAEFDKYHVPGRPIRLRETAASNAVTSLELFEAFDKKWGQAVSMLATDYCDALQVVTVGILGMHCRVVLDSANSLLQFVGDRWVISSIETRKGRRLVFKVLRSTIFPRALAVLSKGSSGVQLVTLFHPRCLALAHKNERFKVGRENAFDPGIARCDVLRTMNLSNLLPREDPAPILKAMCRPLDDGGFWILGDRADGESSMSTTIFQRRGRGFVALGDVEGPYQKKGTVLQLSLD